MMPCENCSDTFAAIAVESFPEPRASYIDERQPRCRCEDDSVSEYSAGPVADDEILIRIVVAPQHVNRKKQPKAGALTEAERSGLSLLRETASDAEVFAAAALLVRRAREKNGPEAGVFGVFNILCRTIRSIRQEIEQRGSYCVYDTAYSDSPSHAEAFQRTAGVDAALCDERRTVLFNAIQSAFIPVSEFRSGLLLQLAAST
jgi:hypothetical protein